MIDPVSLSIRRFAPGPRDVIAAAALEAPGAELQRSLTLAPLDRRFIRAATVDLAGRTPLPSEWQAAQGKPRGEWIREFSSSFVAAECCYEEELFYFLLIDNFRPSTDAFAAIPQLLAGRKLSIREMLRQIVSSQFFNARNPGNDTFATVVLEQLLGITVQKEPALLEAAKRMYDGYPANVLGKSGSSQADFVRIAAEHPQSEPCFVERRFTAIFGDAPPKKRLAADSERLRNEPLSWPDLVAGWLGSLAYEQRVAQPRPKSDRVFVRSLYADLLGRVPDYQEFRRCRNALLALSDSRPLRSVLIKMMLDSGVADGALGNGATPAEQVADRFLHFLARPPTAAESSAFVREIEGGADARLVLRALLTHSEYQSY